MITSDNHSTKVNKKQQRVAIVHDFLLYPGGAENVLSDIAQMFPDAPIYTLLYDKARMGQYFVHRDIRSSFLQKWPRFLRKRYRFLLPFFGTAMESFDFREFDLIISSSSVWSKGIVTRLNTKHIAYIHSPMRYVWDENEHYYKKNVGKKNNFCIRTLLSYLRVWDHQAAQRPDVLVANSIYTQKRIQKYYRRNSMVVYPGVNKEKKDYTKNKTHNKNFFLIIARLSAYKNVALAVDVCNKLQLPLVVVGEGQQRKELEKRAGKTVRIIGWVDDEKKERYIQQARALLFPSEDDFGIVCVEAMTMGTPVIALGKGGACEIVEAGISGELFDVPTVEVMADALRRFIEKEAQYDYKKIQEIGQGYTKKRFIQEMTDIIYREN